MPARRLQHLGDLTVFSKLGPEELAHLARGSFHRRVRKGNRLYFSGAAPDALFAVTSGLVKITRYGADGREIILDMHQAGDCFGEDRVLGNGPDDSEAVAVEHSSFWVVSAVYLRALFPRKPEMVFSMAHLMSKRLARRTDRLVDIALKNVAARLAALLHRLGKDYGVPDRRGTLLRIRLSQKELAHFLGVSRESVNMVVARLREGNVIGLSEGRIVLRRPDVLASLAAGTRVLSPRMSRRPLGIPDTACGLVLTGQAS